MFCTVPEFFITTSPSDLLEGGMVGNFQTIHCMITTVRGVKLSSVKFNWTGPGGIPITNSSRIMITPPTYIGSNSTNSNFSSTLQFMYLMEGDEGRYVCNVSILQTNASKVVELGTLTGW